MPQDITGIKEKLEKINKYISLYELKLENVEPKIIRLRCAKSIYNKKLIKCESSPDFKFKKPLAKSQFINLLSKIDNMLSALRIQKELYITYLIKAQIHKIKLESELNK